MSVNLDSLPCIRVPLTFTLGTSAVVVRTVPLLLVDLETDESVDRPDLSLLLTTSGARAVAGHLSEAIDLVKGVPTTPLDVAKLLQRRFALLGVTGTVRMALSAFDMALWDAIARALGQPLSVLLGASPRPLPAYDSRGLGLMEPGHVADEAEKMLAKGLKALKLRLGYSTLAEDLAALDAVRSRVGPEIEIMVDYNQALAPVEALKRGYVLDHRDVSWIEEPIGHDDYQSLAQLATELQTPIQIGENFNGPEAMLRALKAGASDLMMPDVARIGRWRHWMDAGRRPRHGGRD